MMKKFILIKFTMSTNICTWGKKIDYFKLKYTDCNFLIFCIGEPTKNACMVAKDSNISHYLNISINSLPIILPII